MTIHYRLESFGQEAAPAKGLNEMTRGIASGICDGRRPTFVGFAWYRPQGDLEREVPELLPAVERQVA